MIQWRGWGKTGGSETQGYPWRWIEVHVEGESCTFAVLRRARPMGKTHAWLLYGANGYSGQLIAKEAVRRGMPPTLAGRREGAIRPLAERLGLPCRVFALDPSAPERMAGELEPFEGMLLAAGPFSATSAPMVEACL